MASVTEKARQAKEASLWLSSASAQGRNKALLSIAEALGRDKKKIKEVNTKDLRLAKKENISSALMERLLLDEEKIDGLTKGIHDIIALPDPVDRTLKAIELDQGLELYQVSCPIGVIGVIFESRPDALVQISALCLKSGNAVLLKGGREASHTNGFLFSLI